MNDFTLRFSKWELAGLVIYVALVIAYLEYGAQERQARAQERQARAQERQARALGERNRHLEELRDADPDDDFELADAGCPCAT